MVDDLSPILNKLEVCVRDGAYESLETDWLEIKPVPSTGGAWDNIRDSICAFLNTRGGVVILGVKDEQQPRRPFIFTGYTENNSGQLSALRSVFKDTKGNPVTGVEVDIWHSSTEGFYENQDPVQADMNLRGKFTTDAQGHFGFRSVKPAGYPVPTDGPVGDLLRAQRRHPYRPAHLHFLAFKPGFKTLITQVFVDDDEYLGSDVVFGVTRALIGNYRRHDAGTPPAPDVKPPWYTLDYRFVMEAGEAKLPKPPIA